MGTGGSIWPPWPYLQAEAGVRVAVTSALTQVKSEKRISVDCENIIVGRLVKRMTSSTCLSSLSQALAWIASSPVMKERKKNEWAIQREATTNIAELKKEQLNKMS